MAVAGSAGETTRYFEEQGIPALVMADGPAGLRLSRQYGRDEQGVYAVGDAVPAAFLEYLDEQTPVSYTHLNNQETNRFHSNSMVSERALRDIYMRGFKIAVREAQPHAVMTSYNLLNGEHTSQRADIIKQVLRKEWGLSLIHI